MEGTFNTPIIIKHYIIKPSVYHILSLTVISAILFFTRLGSISVYQVAEARNAQCAREMMQRNDWVVPTFNGELRTDKPILEYWAMIAAYKIGGVNAGSARFFSAICGVLLILLTYLIANQFLVQRSAWWAAFSLLASAHLVVQFRLATPDPYLILFNTLTLYCFIMGWKDLFTDKKTGWHGWKWWCFMYISFGFSLLAKGPVGVALPVFIIFIFLLAKRSFKWSTIKSLRIEWGALITLLIALPWYVLVHIKTGGKWTEGFFLTHNLSRFSDSMDGHGGIFLLPFAFVFAGMLPLSVFAGHALKHAWKKIRQNDFLLLSLIGLFLIIVFYAFSKTKLINYTVPAYPFLAILIGSFLPEFLTFPGHFKRTGIPFIILIWIAILIPGAVFFWTQYVPGLDQYSWIALLFLVFPAGILWGYRYFFKHKTERSIYWIAGTFMVGITMVFVYPYPLLDSQTPMEKSKHLFTPSRPVAAWQKMNDAFVYYADRPIPVLKTEEELNDFLNNNHDGLVISIADQQAVPEERKDLRLIRKDREIFNSHTNYIYQQVRTDTTGY